MGDQLETTTFPSSALASDRSISARSLDNIRCLFFPRDVSEAAGAIAIWIGVFAITGWALRLPGLRGIHPVLSPMGPRTAFCFAFSGLALWLLAKENKNNPRYRFGQGCAALVIAASVLALGLSWSESFSNAVSPLLNPPGVTVFSARMPTATALAFLALGVALLLLNTEFRGVRPAEFLSFAAVLIVVLALVAYGYGFVSLFQTPVRRPLAIHTLAAFLSLSFGILMSRRHVGLMSLATSFDSGGVMLRRLLPAAVLIPGLVGWLITQGERAGLYPGALNLAYYTLAIVVVFGTLVWFTAGSLHRIDARRREAEQQIRRLNAELEQRVLDRTAQLEIANRELESFSYSVSHDLRAPLRAIDGFSRIVMEDYGDRLEKEGKEQLKRVRDASQRMGQLIDDLLNLARVTRHQIRRDTVDLSSVANAIVLDIQRSDPDRRIQVAIEPELRVHADSNLCRIVLDNLISNAWKFTRKKPDAHIAVGAIQQQDKVAYFVRDNGAGFDMAYADKLFGAFQRLHGPSEFEGTGVGLATVQRIVHRHGGRIWAESAVNQGACFYFTLS
jgi:signal transduction histidine kinase